MSGGRGVGSLSMRRLAAALPQLCPAQIVVAAARAVTLERGVT